MTRSIPFVLGSTVRAGASALLLSLPLLAAFAPGGAHAQVTYVDKVPSVEELQSMLRKPRDEAAAPAAQTRGLHISPAPVEAPTAATASTRQLIWDTAPAKPARVQPTAEMAGATPHAVAAEPAGAAKPGGAPQGPAVAMPITFDTNSARVAGPSLGYVEAVAELLRREPSLRLTVEGHTDAVGSAQRNLPLSWERAMSVFNLLVQRGIDPQRLLPMGRGSAEPLEGLPPTAGRNRRVQFRVVG